jgi:DNA-binding transcriptional LysR family regulator
MSRDLEVRHCRVLVAISENGGVASAAHALGLSQSTVSETILSVERILGTQITLRRPGKETALTPAAEAFLPHARALISASDSALSAFASKDRGTIRLGTVESISSFLLPGPLADFRARWPQIDVRITVGLCEDLRRRVRQSELDAAITIEEPGRRGGTEKSGELSPAKLCLVVSPQNALAQRTVAKKDLLSYPFLLADPDGAFNGLMKIWINAPAQNLKFESAGSIDGVKRGVKSGDAIGVLPAYALTDELSSGLLISLKTKEPLPTIALQLTTADFLSNAEPFLYLVEGLKQAAHKSDFARLPGDDARHQ